MLDPWFLLIICPFVFIAGAGAFALWNRYRTAAVVPQHPPVSVVPVFMPPAARTPASAPAPLLPPYLPSSVPTPTRVGRHAVDSPTSLMPAVQPAAVKTSA